MIHFRFLAFYLCCGSTLMAAPRIEVTFVPVAQQYGPVPNVSQPLYPGATIYDVELLLGGSSFALGNDGQVVFTTLLTGDVGSTNNQAILAGLPGSTRLVARTGDSAPGSASGDVITGLFGYQPNISDDGVTAYVSQTGPPGSSPSKGPGHPTVKPADPDKVVRAFFSFGSPFGFLLVPFGEDPAGVVQLSGTDIGSTNNLAVVVGTVTNMEIIAQKGSPAPGTTANFNDFPGFQDQSGLALAPDGYVAFTANTTALNGNAGIWFGKAAAVQAVMIPGEAVPASLMGDGYTYGSGATEVDLNARHEVVFSTTLVGQGLNNTNSDVVLVGEPGALRMVAQSGQPAPGIPGAIFGSSYLGGTFQHCIIGSDGSVAFSASYDNNSGSGLWLAPANGATPVLLMHSGAPAPGMPDGVVFTNASVYSPLVLNAFMNAQGQVAFLSAVSGPGIGDTNNLGIWLADPNGSVSLVVRSGDTIDIGSNQTQRLDYLTLGAESPATAGPEDGRPSLFNANGEIVFSDNSTGIYAAQTGIVVGGRMVENKIHITFPTLAGKHYRVDAKPDLSAASWTELGSLLVGTGSEVTVTNTVSSTSKFYRVVRTD